MSLACLLGIAALAGFLYSVPKPAPDLFWQIRAGRDIAAAGLPVADSYSWSMKGHPWIAMEWLPEVLFAALFKYARFSGPLLLACGVHLIGLFVIFGALRARGIRSRAAFSVTALTAFASAINCEPRPQAFSYAALAVQLGIFVLVRHRLASPKLLFALPVVMVLWGNCHPAAAVGAGLILVLTLGDMAHVRRYPDSPLPTGVFPALFAALLNLAAVAATPYGIKPLIVAFDTIRDASAMGMVAEWQPLPFWPDPAQLPLCQWLAFAALCLLAIGHLIQNFRALNRVDLVVIGAAIAAAVAHRRNLPLSAEILSLLAVPCMLVKNTDQLNPPFRIISLGTTPAAAVCLLFFSSFYAMCSSPAAPYHQQLSAENIAPLDRWGRCAVRLDEFPNEAASFIEYIGLPQGLHWYNDYNLGGYLILRLPQQPVFIDGRADIYSGKILDGAAAIARSRPGALSQEAVRFLDDRPFDAAITSQENVARYFASRRSYALIYVYRKPQGGYSGLNTWIYLRKTAQMMMLIRSARQAWAAHNGNQMPD